MANIVTLDTPAQILLLIHLNPNQLEKPKSRRGQSLILAAVVGLASCVACGTLFRRSAAWETSTTSEPWFRRPS